MKLQDEKVPHLLATPGEAENCRSGVLGRIMHDIGKFLMRAAVDRIWNKMRPVIEYKKANGWIHIEVAELYDDMGWALLKLDNEYRENTDKKNRRFMERLRDIVCVTLDEDTYYSIRFWVLMWRMHERGRWNSAYDVPTERSHSYFNYRAIYDAMKAKEAANLEKAKLKGESHEQTKTS